MKIYEKMNRSILVFISFALTGLLIASCSSGSKTAPHPGGVPQILALNALKINGNNLLALGDRVLYYFSSETNSHILCTGSCLSIWPEATASSNDKDKIVLPAPYRGALGKIKRGSTYQITFGDHPLYFYAFDKPDEALGEGIQNSYQGLSGIWSFVLLSSTSARASGSTSTSTTQGGSGYSSSPTTGPTTQARTSSTATTAASQNYPTSSAPTTTAPPKYVTTTTATTTSVPAGTTTTVSSSSTYPSTTSGGW